MSFTQDVATFRLSAPSARMAAGPKSLKDLLEQSRKLQASSAQSANNTEASALPPIQLGLDQIESQSRRLISRAARVHGSGDAPANEGPSAQTANARAHYLLAAGGINAEDLGRNIHAVDLKGTFEPLQPLHDSDVEGLLRHEHEQSIISAIEEGRRQTVDEFYKSLDTYMRRDWQRTKEALLDELGRHSFEASGATSSSASRPPYTSSLRGAATLLPLLPSGPAFEGVGSFDLQKKMYQYDRVIKGLNSARRQGKAFATIEAMAKASADAVPEGKGQSLVDTWNLLHHLVAPLRHDMISAVSEERKFAAAYLGPPNSGAASALRKQLAAGSLTHLQEQFFAHVNQQLALHPLEANQGGDPSINNKIRAFVHLKFFKGGVCTEKRLEIVNKTPLWARLFYLLRSGYTDEAVTLAQQTAPALSKTDPHFMTYFAQWASSPDRRLSKTQRDRFVSEYNQRTRQNPHTDPFKVAIFKIVGRLDLQRKNIPFAIVSLEDWAWLQLMLVRERVGDETVPERYELADFSNLVLKYGEGHFDPNGTRPLMYCRVLLMSGQFEQAMSFLESKPHYQVDTVHFTIALAYYGLLRVADESGTISPDQKPQPAFNFARMIHRYTRVFASAGPREALQYLYLICLNADAPPPAGPHQVQLCHSYIRDLVLETSSHAPLIGTVQPDGTFQRGQIEEDLPLLCLENKQAFLEAIVLQTADRMLQQDRHFQALALYHLAQRYDRVISALNARLGTLLSREGASDEGLTSEHADPVTQARKIREFYETDRDASRTVTTDAKRTCDLLLLLNETASQFRASRYKEAYATLEQVDFVPGGGDVVDIIRKAEQVKDLDDAILRNLDAVLLLAMRVTAKVFEERRASPFADPSRTTEYAVAQGRARALTTFAGMLRYRLTPQTYEELARVAVALH